MNADESSARARHLWIAGLLAALTIGLYASTGRFEFLNYDDPDYVSHNPVVAHGLDPSGVEWAFGFHASNWHPLTWLAHMLDVQLFGLEPGPMHLVNAGLHALNAALLFLALVGLTRSTTRSTAHSTTHSTWASLLVAALFAAHPLRVQAVAWIAERKELLAGAFFLGMLCAYGRWARTRSPGAYAAVFACLVLGLLAKPMLVTAPFLLLLLDVWPLRRLGSTPVNGPGPRAVVLEKLPLLALCAASCVLTILAQRAGGALRELGQFSVLDRVWTAGAGVLAYLWTSLWPSGLAAFYPHPLLIGKSILPAGALGLAVALLGSLGAWFARRSAPAVFTGWFWFLGMLVPVLGLVQVGDQAWADRYAYLPTIGLAIALVFGLTTALRERATLQTGLGLVGLACIAALATVTLRILPSWRTNLALFERALAVTEGNWIAHNNLGLVYLERREMDRALEHFQSAARLRPGFVEAHYNMGLAQEGKADFPAAEKTYRAVLEQRPGHAESLLRLAQLARANGRTEHALSLFEQAIQANPSYPPLWTAFARFLLDLGDVDRAANVAESALKLDASGLENQIILIEIALRRGDLDDSGERLARVESRAPESAEVCALRARWRFQKNDLAGARAAFERAIQLDPSGARARHDFGALLMGLGELEGARNQFQALNDIRPGDPQALIGLAAVALEEDKAEEAVKLLEAVLQRMPDMKLALVNLGAAHERLGHWKQALESYKKSFTSGPPDPDAACSAAWILATGPDLELLDGDKAVELANYAAQRQAANALEVLAAALARQGDFDQAVAVQEQAMQRVRKPEQKRALEGRLEQYRAGKPYTRP